MLVTCAVCEQLVHLLVDGRLLLKSFSRLLRLFTNNRRARSLHYGDKAPWHRTRAPRVSAMSLVNGCQYVTAPFPYSATDMLSNSIRFYLTGRQVPATIRLQRAMEAHAALQARTTQRLTYDPHPSLGPYLEIESSVEDNVNAGLDLSTVASASIDDLATQLKSLWQREKEKVSNIDFQIDDDSTLPSLRAALHKIGSCEKDELLLHLLEQQDALRTQRSEVAALGEKIAAQLLHQQVRLERIVLPVLMIHH